MRHIRIFLLFLLLMITGNLAQAQNSRSAKDSIVNATMGGYRPVRVLLKTSILSPFYWQIPLTGEYRVLSEIMLGRRQSVQLGVSYLTRSLFFAIAQKANKSTDKIGANGFRIQGSYKYYLVNRKYRPEGIFVSLHSSLASVHFNYKNSPNDYQTLQHFNVNLLIGGQILIANRVSLELFFGPGYKNNIYTSHARPGYEIFDFDALTDNYFRHFKMSAGMNVGIVL